MGDAAVTASAAPYWVGAGVPAGITGRGGNPTVGVGVTGWTSPRSTRSLPDTVIAVTCPPAWRALNTVAGGWLTKVPRTPRTTSYSMTKNRVDSRWFPCRQGGRRV